MSDNIFISLCLITKNEECCLARCLESAKKLVDEIIVVDTGSEDNTVRIAVEHGAHVFSFSWIDDFSAARNYAISKAHGHWILILDADEVLALLSREELAAFMEQSPAEGYYFKICSYLDHVCETIEDYVVRLFKNRPEYRFSGAIHEQIAGSIQSSNAKSGLILCPFTIFHYGYMAKVLESKCKFKRNISVIQKALTEKPQDPFLHYCLGVEFLQNKDFQQAGPLLKRTLTLLRGDEGYLPQVLVALLLVKLTEPEDYNGEELFRRAIQTMPDNGDLYCLYGVWLMQHTRFFEAAKVLEMALLKNIDLLERGRLKSFLGDVYFLADMSDQAAEYYKAALCENDTDLYPLVRLLNMWGKGSGLEYGKMLCVRLTPELTNGLLQRATQEGMFDVVLAVNLIAIIESICANDIERVTVVCDTYLEKLASASSESNLHSDVYAILSRGGEELLLQSRLLELSCGHLNIVHQDFIDCVLIDLFLLSSLVEEISPTEQLKFWEEVFIGEARSDCQPC